MRDEWRGHVDGDDRGYGFISDHQFVRLGSICPGCWPAADALTWACMSYGDERRDRCGRRTDALPHATPPVSRLSFTTMSEHRLSFSIPLDDDGFLRRECPRCERELKWRPDEDDVNPEDVVPTPEEGYACPYCAGRAPADHWWTKPQLMHAEQLAASEILGPELKQLERRPDPGSMISLSVKVDVPDTPAPITDDPNDMRRVDFACHPSEPVKILQNWMGDVHCLICAMPASPDD